MVSKCVTIESSNMLRTYSARSIGGQNHSTISRTKIIREKEEKEKIEDRLKRARTKSFTPTIGVAV